MLADLDCGAVQHQGALIRQVPGDQLLKNMLPKALQTPSAKPGVHTFPWTIPLRQVPPRYSGIQPIQNSIEHYPVVFSGRPPCGFFPAEIDPGSCSVVVRLSQSQLCGSDTLGQTRGREDSAFPGAAAAEQETAFYTRRIIAGIPAKKFCDFVLLTELPAKDSRFCRKRQVFFPLNFDEIPRGF